MKDFIKLLINRKWETIPTKDILYITISDKLSFLHLKENVTLNLFITLSELEQQLPEADFVRISRNCIVNFHAIYAIYDTQVHLANGETLPYSKRREKCILDGYQQHLQNKFALSNPEPDRKRINFQKKYEGFDQIPIAFAVVEIILDENGVSRDYVLRYANQALAELERIPLSSLIGHPFPSLFSNAHKKWLSIYREVAFCGKQLEVVEYSPKIEKTLRIQCFQPLQGYCACLLTDVTGKTAAQDSGYICPRKFTDADICQRFLPLLNEMTQQQLDTLEHFLVSIHS